MGNKPELYKVSTKQQLIAKFKKLFEYYKQKGYNNIGVITKTSSNSVELFNILSPHFSDVKLITENETYLNGTVIIDAFSSKGLEFDAVIMFNINNVEYSTELDKQLLYVAVTRALHDICLIHTKEPSSFVTKYFNGLEEK